MTDEFENKMSASMRIFGFKYLGPTENQPSRVAIYDKRFGSKKVISWDYKYNSAGKNAAAFLVSIGYEIIGFSDDENVIVTKGWKKIPLNGGA